MNALVVYYSLTGRTRSVATALAKELGADVEEIRCSRYFPSFLGFIRAGYDSWRGKLPLIEPTAHAPQHYDVVVVGAPIWAWHVATPVRAYLREERSKLPRVGFFLTHGGSGSEPAFREMKTLAGRAPIATLVVREKDVKEGKCRNNIVRSNDAEEQSRLIAQTKANGRQRAFRSFLLDLSRSL